MRVARHSLRFFLLVLLTLILVTSSVFAQSFSSIAIFNLSNGLQPEQPLTLGSDGTFYGSTEFGGNLSCNSGYGCGAIFRMTPNGALSVLYSFSGGDGEAPYGVVQGVDGNFYGTTFCSSGAGSQLSLRLRPSHRRPSQGADEAFFCQGPGSVFKLLPGGTLITLHLFIDRSNGLVPSGPLVQGRDGNFYGVTSAGGANDAGTIYRITPNGTLTTLYNFCSQPNCSDGADGSGSLVQGADGNFYGTTSQGGNDACNANGGRGCGTIFRMTPAGVVTTLHRFTGLDGQSPNGGLVAAADGTIYGASALGGLNQNCPNNTCGTLFRLSPAGAFTTLYNFDGGVDGAEPSPLMLASDGNLYGTTYWGGSRHSGTVFRITPSGTLSTLHSFCSEVIQTGCGDGEGPGAGLVQGADGRLYGTTTLGGLQDGTPACNGGVGCGTVFATSAISPATQFVPFGPCRVMDTRIFDGAIQGGTQQSFPIITDAQQFRCGDLSTAIAFSLNITAVPHGPLGYLTVWEDGSNQPIASTLNSPDGQPKANALIVSGASEGWMQGVISIYASDTTDILIDVNGYFTTPSSETLQFYPLTPCRAVDTRNGQNGGTLQAGVERDYTMSGQCGIPAGAQAYSLNVTALPASGGLDYLTVWTQGQPRPSTSTLNADAGGAVANAAIVAAGSNQSVAFYANSNNTDLLVDVNGYFAPAGEGGNSLYTVPSCRIYDSRDNNGQPFSGEKTIDVAAQPCAPPANTQAYVFNATVVPSRPMPYLTLWADGASQPEVSTLNAFDGLITSNMAIVPTTNGSIDAYAAGLTQMILDISGFFAP